MKLLHFTQKHFLLARPATMLLLVVWLSACATQPVTNTNPDDPWEPFNRKVYAFNRGFDKAIFKPVAKGYDAIMPDAPQRGVRNFFRNWQAPLTFVNQLLQGKVDEAFTTVGVFLMNTTLGLGGFFDIGAKAGAPQYKEDFGQTMAVWGWKKSRYLVVPILGPYTVRDLGGRGVVSYWGPTSFVIREYNNYVPLIVDLVSIRAELLPLDKTIEKAPDPYAMVRDAYLQIREYEIYDGDPPAPDYDALLEEY
ncbi:MAG TPA: VacJ family lipoprotein [Xanthomonadales bacterium]|nr:VacJ family lipoprotein [Xanthomonadales bacterium]